MTTQTKTTWRKVKLGEVLSLLIDHRGKTPKKLGGDWSREGIPAISAKNIKSGQIVNESNIRYINQKLYDKWMPEKLEKGDVLLTSEAPLGELLYLKEKTDYCLSQRLFALRTQPQKLNSKFLYYYFLSPIGMHQLLRRISGTAAEGIRQAELRQLEVSYPENPTTQKRIADILSAFDDKVELNNKISRTLEQMAQAIFKEWFIDSEKLKVKSEKLGDLVKIISGHPFSSKLYTKNRKALGVVTIKNVQDGNFITSCDSFIDEKNVPTNMNQECRIHDGDILLSLTGNVGRVCFVYGGEYLLNQRVAKLEPKETKDRAFCYFLFRQVVMQNQLINMAKGSAQPNLSPVETGEITLTIPPLKTLDKFNELAGPIYNRLVRNEVENQKLAALRDLLLPKLMSGEVLVKSEE